jgi:hypothetical protein
MQEIKTAHRRGAFYLLLKITLMRGRNGSENRAAGLCWLLRIRAD